MAFIIYTEFIFTNYYLCQIKDYFYQNKLYLHFFLYLQIQAFFIWDLQSCRISSLIIHSLRHPWLSHNETILQSRKSTGGKGLTAAASCCISCPTSFTVSFLIIFFAILYLLETIYNWKHPWAYSFWSMVNKQYAISEYLNCVLVLILVCFLPLLH